MREKGKLGSIVAAILIFLVAANCYADSWGSLRTSGPGRSGWQPLICQTGTGWQSCEMPVNIALTATPTSLVAIGETSTITATVTDYYGVAIEGATLNWTNTDGSISAWQTVTNASGISSLTLTSSRTLGGTTVTAETLEKDGKGAIFVPFIDKWVYYPSGYTAWANTGGVYSCSAWSPDPSTVPSGTWFTQWASCWQTQYQYRYDYEQSVVSGAIRQVGGPVALYQAIIVGVSQANVGTLYVPPAGPVCIYDGANYIMHTHDCRGSGNPAELRIGGANVGAYAGPGVNNRPTYSYNGYIWYTGSFMRTQSKSCAGSDGAIDYYQACHD